MLPCCIQSAMRTIGRCPTPPPHRRVDGMRSKLGRGGDAKQEGALEETIKRCGEEHLYRALCR